MNSLLIVWVALLFDALVIVACVYSGWYWEAGLMTALGILAAVAHHRTGGAS